MFTLCAKLWKDSWKSNAFVFKIIFVCKYFAFVKISWIPFKLLPKKAFHFGYEATSTMKSFLEGCTTSLPWIICHLYVFFLGWSIKEKHSFICWYSFFPLHFLMLFFVIVSLPRLLQTGKNNSVFPRNWSPATPSHQRRWGGALFFFCFTVPSFFEGKKVCL